MAHRTRFSFENIFVSTRFLTLLFHFFFCASVLRCEWCSVFFSGFIAAFFSVLTFIIFIAALFILCAAVYVFVPFELRLEWEMEREKNQTENMCMYSSYLFISISIWASGWINRMYFTTVHTIFSGKLTHFLSEFDYFYIL